MGVKISIIGAGSAVFSINLIKDICVNSNFDGSTVCLMDINERRLNGIYKLCKRYIEEGDRKIKLEGTLDREEALKGADFVVHVALDGGHKRMTDGWKVAKELGYRFGGSLHVMHDEAFWINFYQLKLMEEVYLDMQRLCPKAWMIMVANPVQAAVTYLCRKYPGAKIIGMCHGGYRALQLFKLLGLDRKDCSYECSGVNHFVFMNTFYHKGQDGFPILDKWIEEGKNIEMLKTCPENQWSNLSKYNPKAIDIYNKYGAFPIGDTASPGGGAWGWWYDTDDAKEKFMDDPDKWWDRYFSTLDSRLETLWNKIEDPSTNVTQFFGSVASDEPMIPTIEGLAFDVEHKVIVNILNSGNYVPGIPLDYECECWAMVNGSGVHGLSMTPLPRQIIAPVEMELEAFRTGRKDLLVLLVLMDPWTKTLDQAEKLVDAILDLPGNEEMKEYYKN